MNAVLDQVNTAAMWVGLGVLAWLGVGSVVAPLLGRWFRAREQQVPQDAARSATPPETTEH